MASVVILQHLTGKRVDFILKHMSTSLFEMSSKLITSLCRLGWRLIFDFTRWLHNETLLATAQKQHVFIYDQSGLEIHRLKHHQDVNKLEFLPYHFLLASVVGDPSCIMYIHYDLTIFSGQCRLSQIPRYIYRPIRDRVANEVRLLSYNGTESMECYYTFGTRQW